MADCLFCKIIAREIPASIVYEDDRILVFNDINPQAPTHVLVVPKRHIESLNELTAGDDALVGEVVRRAAAIAKDRGISAGGGHRERTRHFRGWLQDGIQHESSSRADRLSYSPAPARRAHDALAAWVAARLQRFSQPCRAGLQAQPCSAGLQACG